MVIRPDDARERARWWLSIMSNKQGSEDYRQFVEDSLTDLLVAVSQESQDDSEA